MNKSFPVLVILSTATFAPATQLYYDGFNYPAGSGLGTNPPWQDVVVRTPPVTVQTGSLNYPGLPTYGNSVQLNNAFADTNVVSLGSTPITTGTLYYSMIVQLNAGITSTNQAFFAGFDDHSITSATFSTGAALVAKMDPNDGTQLDLGIAAPGNNNSTKKYGGPYSTSDVLFVVGSYTFNPAGATDDVVNMYVFANGAPIPSAEPASPTATATTASTNTDLTQITRFYLRNNTGEPPTILADELRIGTTWSSVLPLAGDTNFNGKIDADDYALLDRGYALYQSGAITAGAVAWTDGDFNLDHAVDAADYLAIDQAFVNQGGSLSPDFLSQRASEFGDAYVASLVGSVPEPSTTALITLSAGLVRRRARMARPAR